MAEVKLRYTRTMTRNTVVDRKIEIVVCSCGCRKTLNKYDSRNRIRVYIKNHSYNISHDKQFKIGNKPWNKGGKLSLEIKQKISCAKKEDPTRYWLGKKRSTETKLKISEAKKGIELSEEHKKKLSEAHKGEKAYNWKGNRSKIYGLRRRAAYKAWRTLVFERDDYTCQECGERGMYANAHHIKGVAEYPELVYEVDNGVTLCERCHARVDKYFAQFMKGGY